MAKGDDDASIIVLEKFIQATRDSGYKGTTSALAEIVDNSLQAGAKRVWINIVPSDDPEFPLTISVLDDGSGMDRKTLRDALRFGGSSRFDDRTGLGRYGMGLPNSSLSQARRLEVFSWARPSGTLFTYLDVDEIASGKLTAVPDPESASKPKIVGVDLPSSGTLVVWSRCDRLSHSRASTIIRKVSRSLGQIYRHFLWNGTKITINGEAMKAIDPLFLRGANATEGTSLFGEPIKYEVAIPSSHGQKARSGIVTVTFTELPIHSLHELSNDEKRERGISNGAGVSIVRGMREVDYGWFFLNGKRRENYDDWWRCEISFDPVLDEAFGITHTKQQIRPQETLIDILSADMESMAKSLNSRVRQAHLRLKSGEVARVAEETAAKKERLLEPLPRSSSDAVASPSVKAILKQHPALSEPVESKHGAVDYKIVEVEVKDTEFFFLTVVNGHFVLALNTEHPFFRRVYKPLSELDTAEARQARTHIDVLLLAAARAEAATSKSGDRKTLAEHRKRWSDVLATYLNR